jgi:hypothetical protein
LNRRSIHHRDTEFAEIGVFLTKNSLLCALSASGGELSFDRYTKSGYCHEGYLTKTGQAAENDTYRVGGIMQ